MVPLEVTDVVAPVLVLRLYVSNDGSVVDVLYRQLTPKTGSETLKDSPIIRMLWLDMTGSVPENELYCRCQGSVSLRAVALPLAHLVTFAAVKNPIRELATFAMVLEWNVPLSMTSHSTVPKPPLKFSLAQLALIICVVLESLPADAEDTSAARTRTAPAIASANLVSRMLPPY